MKLSDLGVALKRTKLIPARARESRRLVSRLAPLYICEMNLKEGASVVADLTTIGRKSGQPRTVEMRFVYRQGCYYASSSKVAGKHWCLNMLKNPSVQLELKGERLSCAARQVTDDGLRREILTLRDNPPQMDRVVFEIKPLP